MKIRGFHTDAEVALLIVGLNRDIRDLEAMCHGWVGSSWFRAQRSVIEKQELRYWARNALRYGRAPEGTHFYALNNPSIDDWQTEVES